MVGGRADCGLRVLSCVFQGSSPAIVGPSIGGTLPLAAKRGRSYFRSIRQPVNDGNYGVVDVVDGEGRGVYPEYPLKASNVAPLFTLSSPRSGKLSTAPCRPSSAQPPPPPSGPGRLRRSPRCSIRSTGRCLRNAASPAWAPTTQPSPPPPPPRHGFTGI